MNSPQKNINNILFVPKSKEYVGDMYGAILQLTLTDKTIVVLTQSIPKLLPLMKKLKIELHKSKKMLQRLIFMCCENISTAIRKLFDLHDWTIKPSIVIIDLYSFVEPEDPIGRTHLEITTVPFLQQVVYCIASLFNLMNVFGSNVQRYKDHNEQQKPNSNMFEKVFSIVVLKERGKILSLSQVEFVQEVCYGGLKYNDFSMIVEKIQ